MGANSTVPADISQFLEDMLAADGYHVVVHAPPSGDPLRVRLEIVPGPVACPDCLVPKAVLVQVLRQRLPDGLKLDEIDLIYPGDCR